MNGEFGPSDPDKMEKYLRRAEAARTRGYYAVLFVLTLAFVGFLWRYAHP